MNRLVAVLLGAALAAAAFGRVPTFKECRAIQDSLRSMPMRMQSRWLAKRGMELPKWTDPAPAMPESGGLRLVGKWGRGDAVEVTGRGSLIFLSLGSEVAIIDFADTANPRVLAEVQAMLLVTQAAVCDSFLYIGCNDGRAGGLEVWNIEDPSAPVLRSRVSMRLTDFCVQDTFAYVTSRMDSPSQDTFRVYSLADPANPRLVGSCRDSGDIIHVSGTKAVVADWHDIHIMDVSDPAHPRRAGSIGIEPLGLDVRGDLLCATKWWNGKDDRFWVDMFDISDPANPRLLGQADSAGGWDIHLSGPLAFASGFNSGYGFTILDIGDSAHPRVISRTMTPGDRFAVWADWTSTRAYSASGGGLTAIDISNLNAPRVDTTILEANDAEDVSVEGDLACVADVLSGMKILDVSNPTMPAEVGSLDTAGQWDVTEAAVIRDSFAFIGWAAQPRFRCVDISDPADPTLVGGVNLFNWPDHIVLRDSLAYVGEYARLQIVNIARPREPVLLGTCKLGSCPSSDIALVGDIAYVASLSFTTVDVANPDSPVVINEWANTINGFDLVDTVLYMAGSGLQTASVANPAAPYLLDSVYVNDFTQDVVVIDTLAILGGNVIRTYNVADPRDIKLVASWRPPGWVYRFLYRPPYLYAACYNAGVCIFETTHVAIAELPGPLVRCRMTGPTIAGAAAWKTVTRGATAFDATGRRVTQAKPGVYFIVEEPQATSRKLQAVRKVVLVK